MYVTHVLELVSHFVLVAQSSQHSLWLPPLQHFIFDQIQVAMPSCTRGTKFHFGGRSPCALR